MFLYFPFFTTLMEAVLAKLKKNKLIESLIQFGSSLERGDYRDIDLCLFTSRKLDLKEKLVLQRDLPEKYDISFYDDLPLHLKREVLTTGKILFTRDYYKLLQQILYVDLEYPRYKAFLDEYHAEMMATV